jgi:hypothetical protein
MYASFEDPHCIVSLLGVSAPQQASFFSTYILLLVSTRLCQDDNALACLALSLHDAYIASNKVQAARLHPKSAL